MILSVRQSALCLLIILGGCEFNRQDNGKHLLTLLGYLQGYKMSNHALHLPSMWLHPFVVIATINQQHSVNVQKETTAEDNYQESGDTIQTIVPAKLKINEKYEKQTEKNHEQLRDATLDDVTQIKKSTENVIENKQDTIKSETTSSITSTDTEPESVKTVTIPIGNYPTANYIDKVNTTVVPSFDKDNNTQNNDTESKFPPKENSTTTENIEDKTDNTRGPYPAALYTAKVEDVLLTTTEHSNLYHTQKLPYVQDSWKMFTLNKNMLYKMNGFKPLAGLYYDGFLNHPLNKKGGFKPNNINFI